jgi:hypothetical protein
MDIAQILSRKFAGTEWSLNGDDYAGLTWLSEGEAPTEKQLEALWPEVQYEVAYEQVEQARSQAYQKDSDPIFFQYQRGDKTEAEWLAAVEAVKAAHPYPKA